MGSDCVTQMSVNKQKTRLAGKWSEAAFEAPVALPQAFCRARLACDPERHKEGQSVCVYSSCNVSMDGSGWALR